MQRYLQRVNLDFYYPDCHIDAEVTTKGKFILYCPDHGIDAEVPTIINI